jgi:uncharacterized protein with GYD domain
MIDHVGGKLEAFHFAFGHDDVVSIAELPDDITAAAMMIAVCAGGSVKSIKTTPALRARCARRCPAVRSRRIRGPRRLSPTPTSTSMPAG